VKYLLDANSIIHLLTNEFPRLTARVAECEEGSLATSAIAFAEVALGSAAGRPPPPEALDAFASEIEMLPFDGAAARTYAGLPFKRASYDRLIAAHAIATGLTLVTSNVDDFTAIPGLDLEDWTR
jgi:tRNA(fMet)-specific endonuclease VapC